MPKHKTLYIEIDDEVTTVAEKLRKTQSELVTLVIPKGAILMQSIVNLKLLERISKKLKKKLAVVTADASTRNIVTRAGLLVQKSANSSFPTEDEVVEDENDDEVITADDDEADEDEMQPKKPHSDGLSVKEYSTKKAAAVVPLVHAKKHFAKKPLVAEEAKSSVKERLERVRAIKSKREAATRKVRLPKNFAKFTVLIAGVVGIVVLAILMIVLPKATITVIPQSEAASDTINIMVLTNGTANADINQVNGKFVEVQKKESKNFPATGQKDFGDPAQGIVTFSNAFSSSPESLAAGTKLRAADGRIYKLDTPVSIPGAEVEGGATVPGTITATATAEAPGEKYNSSSMGLTITSLSANKQTKVTASTTGFKDGTTEMKKVVSKEDIAKAKEAFEPEAKNLAKEELKTKVEAGQTLQDPATILDVTESKSLVAEGAEAESFDYSVTARARAITFSEEEVKTVASSALESKLQGEKTLLSSDSGTFTMTAQNLSMEAKTVLIATKVEKKAIPNIDLSATPTELTGKSDSEIRGFFAKYPEIKSVTIEFWPFWVKKAPRNAEKITIILDTE